MDTQNENREMLSPYVSVDCVLLGINDDKLTVLLAERKSEEGELIGYKIPGSLIYENEDLDDAAYRILNDSTGLKRVQLKQFRCFGSPARTSNRLDVMWLEATSKVKIGRLITPCARTAGRRVRPINPTRSVGALSTSFLACHSIIKRLSRLPYRRSVIGWRRSPLSFSTICR